MTESGWSSIYLYGLAEGATELKFAYDEMKNRQDLGVAGIRNMGGGFNATTLALVDSNAVEVYQEAIGRLYAQKFHRPYYFIVSRPAPRAGLLDAKMIFTS